MASPGLNNLRLAFLYQNLKDRLNLKWFYILLLMSKAGLKHLRKDKKLAKVISQMTIAPLEMERDVFQDLVRSIISQQLSVKAAKTIYDRFLHLFSKKTPTPRKILNKSIVEMRAVGMSNAKASYVHNVARFFLQHKYTIEDWRNMEEDELLTLLTSIKGVGEWTAQMILIFSVHKPDIFPLKDVGIQNAIKKLYQLDLQGKALQEHMKSLCKAWSPHRSLACRLLWSWLDNAPD